MKAIGLQVHGEPDVLSFVEIDEPQPRPGDLTVEVRAVSINPIDEKVRRGWHLHPLQGEPPVGTTVAEAPLIPGWDGAGVVTAVGPEAGEFRVGDAVWFAGDLSRQGSYAERMVVDARLVARKPASLSFEQAAAVPLTALTVWEALFERMAIPLQGAKGSLLIVGGAGGVGSLAIQLARQLTDLQVIATASRAESRAFCEAMGAQLVIDHSGDLADQLKAADLDGVDYILNTNEPGLLPRLSAVLRPLGSICFILPALEAPDPAAMLDLYFKSARICFELMFSRSLFTAEPERQGQILAKVAELFEQGRLRSRESRQLNWAEVREGHRLIETGHTIGKLVMTIDPEAREVAP
jgi:zinc-binding alcohol dehydrogenase family protein